MFHGGAGVDTLVINDVAGQLVGTAPNGVITIKGGRSVLYSGVETLDIDGAAGVESIAGPDTADRATAFAGLTPQERFVQALYLDELGRQGTKFELDGWAAFLNAGGSQSAVATAIDRSAEARDHLVKSWYANYLGRPAVGGEEQGWANAILSGQTEEQVLSQFLATPEFYAHAQTLFSSGTADQRFVDALYLTVLDRQPDAAGVAGWVAGLPGLGRAGVALDFLTGSSGQEFRTELFEGYYDALLRRPSNPDGQNPNGLNSWVFSNLDATSVRIAFEAGTEFFVNG